MFNHSPRQRTAGQVTQRARRRKIMKKIQKGKPLEELVKGSMDFTIQLIRDAFRAQFPNDGMNFYMNEIFSDHVIVSDWSSPSMLKTDEYWKVTYSKADASSSPDGSAQREYLFAARDAGEIGELAYQPQTPSHTLHQ